MRATLAYIRALQPPRVPVALRYGVVIAQFVSGRDAELFAGVKREEGAQVTVTVAPDVNFKFAVRAVVREL